MSKLVTIKNNTIEATFSTMGAEIHSVKKDGKEQIWQADPTVWGYHAPLLFPLCGGLKNDRYIYNGKEYSLPKHGFARTTEFESETVEEQKAVFLLKSNEASKKVFPFDYELRVIYTVSENALNITYEVKNLTDGEMYFSIGAHEAYSCPNGIEEYSVIFDKEEDFIATPVDGPLLTYKENVISKSTKELPLKNDYFAIDALVFLNIKSRKVILKNNSTQEEIKTDFEGFPYLLIWTKPNANYICIEPWCGIPDFVDSDYDFKNKVGINKLEKGEIFTRTRKIEF